MQIKPSCRETLSTEAAGIIANNNFPSEDAPVFFGPDGVPLTEEELNFLEENFVSTAAKDQQFYE